MVERAELSVYAHQLGELLGQVYGGTNSSRFVQRFVSEALHLAPSDYEDLGQIVFLECHDLVSQGGKINDKSLEKIVHRIRQRLARHARREQNIDPSLLEQCSIRTSEKSPTNMSESALKKLIDSLSPDEALVLHLSVFEGRALRDIADALGVSLATVYRRLDAAKKHLKALID